MSQNNNNKDNNIEKIGNRNNNHLILIDLSKNLKV